MDAAVFAELRRCSETLATRLAPKLSLLHHGHRHFPILTTAVLLTSLADSTVTRRFQLARPWSWRWAGSSVESRVSFQRPGRGESLAADPARDLGGLCRFFRAYVQAQRLLICEGCPTLLAHQRVVLAARGPSWGVWGVWRGGGLRRAMRPLPGAIITSRPIPVVGLKLMM